MILKLTGVLEFMQMEMKFTAVRLFPVTHDSCHPDQYCH